MKKIIILPLLLICIYGFTQVEIEKKNILNTTPFKYEKVTHTLQGKLNPKFYTSIGYERIVNNWSWKISIQHSFNKIDEECINCADHFYGKGYLRENNIFTGFNYRFLGNSKFQLSIGSDVYYSNVNFSGDFEGGIDGAGTRINNNFRGLGFSHHFGVHFSPISILRISLISSYSYGLSWLKKVDGKVYVQNTESAYAIPEVKIGYLF